MNESERFVADLCGRAFLSLWTFSSPRGKQKGKELCDLLVVCGQDIIIFSVKHVHLRYDSDRELAQKRWIRRAIHNSVMQLYGAERILSQMSTVITQRGDESLALPDLTSRCIHRIAVAIGSDGAISLRSRNFGRGFVHVLDETALALLLRELDTISDLVQYLAQRERALSHLISADGIREDALLYSFLRNDRLLPLNDLVADSPTGWREFIQSKDYQRKREADKASYFWDQIIETFARDLEEGHEDFEGTLGDVEPVMRFMARETRFRRRTLASAFLELIHPQSRVEARWIESSMSTVRYVFLVKPRDVERRYRVAELAARCFIARDDLANESFTVVGIATERYENKPGYSFDAFLLDFPVWHDEYRERAREAREQFKFFNSPVISSHHEDEYPRDPKWLAQ